MQQKFPIEIILGLFEKIVEKVGRPLNYGNSAYFAEQINAQLDESSNVYIYPRYLYDKYRAIQKAKKEKETHISFGLAHLNTLAHYIGYFDFHDFQNTSSAHSTKISPILEGCKGFWYSYVRCNSGRKDVLVAPIQMQEANGKMWMTLYGPNNTYTGELLLKGSCLFCTLDSGKNKILYVTYKIGEALDPAVLQGTFCGMSTAGDPIAGREVLAKQRGIKQLEEMAKPHRIYLEDEAMVKERLDWRIAKYFEHYHENYIKIVNIGTFSLDDLVR